MTTAEQLHEKLKHVTLATNTCRFTLEKCEQIAPLVERINRLKKERNALILAHSYVSPEIVYGVADYSGDSYQLSKYATTAGADIIIFVAVKFMAETAKILNPQCRVYVPSEPNGCSLADSISGDDVRALRRQHPDHAFICYINTTADVKAECDVCVTSSNVYDIVQHFPNDNIVFLPDKLMGQNIIVEMRRRGVQKNIKLWHGTCYVHEEYDPAMIGALRAQYSDLQVLAHPECSPAVLLHSDFVGSTSQLLKYMDSAHSKNFLMLTECGLSARLQVEKPKVNFVGSCTMCKYMKANSLEDVLRVLESPRPADEITLEPATIAKARACIDAMFVYAEKKNSGAP